MKAKQAFLVLGAESSGTRFMRDILVSAGCLGDFTRTTHWQQWDDEPPIDQTPICWHRSYPHGHEFPSLRELTQPLATYHIQAVVLVRDWYCVSRSQQHFQSGSAIWQNLQRAYPAILSELLQLAIPYWLVPYEALILNYEPHARWLLEQLGLPHDRPLPPLIDGNRKYYAG